VTGAAAGATDAMGGVELGAVDTNDVNVTELTLATAQSVSDLKARAMADLEGGDTSAGSAAAAAAADGGAAAGAAGTGGEAEDIAFTIPADQMPGSKGGAVWRYV